MKLFGIKNCSSVKKAVDFLKQEGLEFEFLDIKKLDEKTLNEWLKQKSFKDLINTAGLTAKKLNLNAEKIAKLDEKSLKNLILENPSLIKRPVIENKGKIFIGKDYENAGF